MKEIYVLQEFEKVDLIETFESCIWNLQYYGQGDFELKVAGTDRNISALTPKRYLVRAEDIEGKTYRNVMVILKRELAFDAEKGWVLTVSGKSLKCIVGQRLIWKQTNLSGTVEDGIRQVIKENIIAPEDNRRKINNFITETKQEYPETMELQVFGENIAEWLESICETYGYGWDIYISDSKYVFRLYKGTNRAYAQNDVYPVVFSPEYDNLLSSTYTFDLGNYKNAALIGGEGEGVNQRYSTIGEAAGLERYEMYVDGSGVSSNGEIITLETYMQMLDVYGKQELAEKSHLENCAGAIQPTGMYEINRDFFLGDIVKMKNEKNISAVARIIEMIYADDENGSSVTTTFKDWEVIK